MSYASLDQYDRALEDYDHALSLNNTYASALLYKGIALNHLNRSAEAIRSFKDAIAIQPDYPDVYYHLGSCPP